MDCHPMLLRGSARPPASVSTYLVAAACHGSHPGGVWTSDSLPSRTRLLGRHRWISPLPAITSFSRLPTRGEDGTSFGCLG